MSHCPWLVTAFRLFQAGAMINCSVNFVPCQKPALKIFFERRTLQILIGGSQRETLPHISNASFKVQTLIGALDDAPADSSRIRLLQIQTLRIVVIERGLSESEEGGR